MWTCPKCNEPLEDEFDSCWKCAGKPDRIGLPFGARAKETVRAILLAVGLIPTTWFFFGPIAGFHHMVGFGITFYLVLNGEDPQPGDHMWGEYAVRFFPGRFALGFALWLVAVFLVFKLVRLLTRRHRAA